MVEMKKTVPYGGYDETRGWRRWRVLRPGWGMWCDVRRRLPYYWSDVVDGLNYRTFAGTVRIYFVNLMPALAFVLDMNERTGGYFGVNEALLSSVMAAIVFSLLSAQPLTVVGITGLISLFNYTIYDIVAIYDVALYPRFLVWVAVWAALFHWLVALFNFVDYMRYVTDFSSQAFGAYVGIIYCIKGVELLISEFGRYGPVDGFLSIIVALMFFGTVYSLETIGRGNWFRPWLRELLADYAYPIATIFWTGFSHIPGTLRDVGIATLEHTPAFRPTVERPWVVDWWTLDARWVMVAMPMGFLLTLLFYYDHNVSSIAAQAKQFPLTKPGGFHWDFFLMGCTCLAAGVLGVPLPNGLVPQAPVHTDSVTVYECRLRVVRTSDGGELREPEYVATGVKEQRVSHFLMGLALAGTMTGPLLAVLHAVPRGLFGGVFLVVGASGLLANGIAHKLLFLAREARFTRPADPLLALPRRRLWAWLAWQCGGVALAVALSQTIAAVGFPVLITALIPLRWRLLPCFFTPAELAVLDAPTATADVVLASIGGRPIARHERQGREGLSSSGETMAAAAGDGGGSEATLEEGRLNRQNREVGEKDDDNDINDEEGREVRMRRGRAITKDGDNE